MAAPVYGTDIVTLDGSVYTATGGTSLVLNDYAAFGGGQSGLNEETDYYLIGTECISKNAFGNGAQIKGIVDDTNAGGNIATTLASGNNPGGNQYVYIWCFFSTPASTQVALVSGTQPGGIFAAIGPNTNNYNIYAISGSNLQDYGADWLCGSIDVNVTPANGLSLKTEGSGAGGNYTVFGAGANIPTQGPTKGSPFAIEGIRRGAYIDAVEGETANPVTFSGLEGFDGGNNTTGRLGVFTERRGVFILNTEVRLGSASTLCFMRDSSGITVRKQNDATPSYSNTETDGGKHRIQILNSNSDIQWENVTILEDSIDVLINTTDNPLVAFTACSFFGLRLLQCGGTNTTLTRCTLGASPATISSNTMAGTNTNARTIQNGATITSCTVNGISTVTETSGIEVSGTNAADLSKITNCNFKGNGRALLLGNISGGGEVEVIYDGHTYTPNADGGYTDGATQTSTAGPQGTSNAVIQCNVASGTTLKITVQNTSQIPSVFNEGTGNVIIDAAFVLDVTGLLGNTEVRVYDNPSLFTGGGSSTEVAGAETVAAVTQTNTGSNYIFYSLDITPNVTQIQRQGTGVDFTTIGLISGDKIRVTVRDNSDNPTLQVFDEFEVNGTVTSTVIPVVDVLSSSTNFSSVIGGTTNTKIVTIEKVNATQTFSVSSGTYDIFVYRIGSLPIITKGFEVTENSRIPISQAGDRVYKNPA